MKSPMREHSAIEVKRGVCCFKFAEMMIGLNMGIRVPMSDVLLMLQAAANAGIDKETGFFVAVTIGHRIHEHGDTLEEALSFASMSGVPDMLVKARKATAADLVSDCDINAELALSMVDGKGALPETSPRRSTRWRRSLVCRATSATRRS